MSIDETRVPVVIAGGHAIEREAIVTTEDAAFKAPKHVLLVDTVGRAANGKVDYKRCRAEAVDRVG